MIVTRDLSSEPKLKRGSEILAIDCIPVQDIFDRLMTITRADGSNDAKRRAYLEVLGTGKYEAFDVFMPLFFPTIGERMELLIRETPTKAPITVVVAAQYTIRTAKSWPRRRKRRSGAKPSRSGDSRHSTTRQPTCGCRVGHYTTVSGTGRGSWNEASTT